MEPFEGCIPYLLRPVSRDIGALGWYHELTPRPLVDEGFLLCLGAPPSCRQEAGAPVMAVSSLLAGRGGQARGARAWGPGGQPSGGPASSPCRTEPRRK